MSAKPVWECRKHGEIYQISAIVRDGESVYRACQSVSQSELDNAWYPDLLIESSIVQTNNSLCDMIAAISSPENNSQ